jgi:hypothetical protein
MGTDLTQVESELKEVPSEELRCSEGKQGCLGADFLVSPATHVFLSSTCLEPLEGAASWVLTLAPLNSRATLLHVAGDPTLGDGVLLELDVTGAYHVELTTRTQTGETVRDFVPLRAAVIGGVSVELTWRDASDKDFDLHLMLDEGPGVPGASVPFCRQDCFFWNPVADLLGPGREDDPLFRRDDMGNRGGAEVIAMPRLTPGTRWRVGAHAIGLGDGGSASPRLSLIDGETLLAELMPPRPIASREFWMAARLVVPADGGPLRVERIDDLLTPTSASPAPVGKYTEGAPNGGACSP